MRHPATEHHPLPEFGQPLPVPVREPDAPEGVNLSVLGYNELMPAGQAAGRLAAAGAIIDLALRGHMFIQEYTNDEGKDFVLIKQQAPEDDNLLPEESKLLELCFSFQPRTQENGPHYISLNTLGTNGGFAQGIDAAMRSLRRRMVDENYFGRPPSRSARLGRTMAGAGLIATGIVASQDHAAGLGVLSIVAGVGTAVYEPLSKLADFYGRHLRGEIGLAQISHLHRAAHAVAQRLEPLYGDDLSAALAPVRENPATLRSYERTLPMLMIHSARQPRKPNSLLLSADRWEHWTKILAHAYDERPAWLRMQDTLPPPAGTQAQSSGEQTASAAAHRPPAYDPAQFENSLNLFALGLMRILAKQKEPA